ncbi:acetamidase/formamidase family protein [Actinomadura namibiensis]|uniref:Formamidase n=1 Tax=Actinomadura namibiensis TaxID=182080 RepID=A0A7W3LJG2_ACTNM|nr:acetamidase/formamidase family protein [Actinomadura namibiensis]MBA8949294.1 formamidase [Actinomadura namibiensis]
MALVLPLAPLEPAARGVPGHDRWHPDIPAAAEVITGGSVRMDCPARAPGAEPVPCGPLVVVGAEPGDVIVVDVLGVGRADGRSARGGHPGLVGCAPDADTSCRAGVVPGGPAEGALPGRVAPGHPPYGRAAAEALRGGSRGRRIASCGIARLTAGSRILLPVHVRGAKLSVGDLHFPEPGAPDCRRASAPGWIDLRVNLTRQGVTRFRVTGPTLMPSPD